MPPMTAYAPGTFCWTDLAAHDTRAAERFYTALFGWTARHDRFGPGDDEVYVMLQKDGRDAAALYAMDPTQKSQGIPSSWLSYVAVKSAADAAARARGLGAAVLADAFDVMDFGRMALLSDPTGAVLAVWEAGKHIGAGVKHDPGTLTWNALATRQTERAASFYAGLFGWTTTASEGAEGPYTLFMDGEAQAGGMLTITPQMGEMPVAWTPYFAVEDTDAAARHAEALGATVLHPPHDLPVGRGSLLRDPQGAMFNVIALQ
ncbi:MAG TPA: VOC family protein, partial [Longimicrobium sp.]|nr:VOC family protein [Longimicrobium sp.]